MQTRFDAELATAQRFFSLMAEGGEPVTFQTFGDRAKNAKLSRVLHGTIEERAAQLEKLNATGAGVFWMVLSGYPCALYDEELYADWQRVERPHLADGGRPRTEVLWINAACQAALERTRTQPSLLSP